MGTRAARPTARAYWLRHRRPTCWSRRLHPFSYQQLAGRARYGRHVSEVLLGRVRYIRLIRCICSQDIPCIVCSPIDAGTAVIYRSMPLVHIYITIRPLHSGGPLDATSRYLQCRPTTAIILARESGTRFGAAEAAPLRVRPAPPPLTHHRSPAWGRYSTAHWPALLRLPPALLYFARWGLPVRRCWAS